MEIENEKKCNQCFKIHSLHNTISLLSSPEANFQGSSSHLLKDVPQILLRVGVGSWNLAMVGSESPCQAEALENKMRFTHWLGYSDEFMFGYFATSAMVL